MVALPNLTDGGISSKWDQCRCQWKAWGAWGKCSRECNGYRERSRVIMLDSSIPGCKLDFKTCTTFDMGWDDSRCNTFCHNGGTSNSYSCRCVTGFQGSCCGFRKNL